MLTGWEGNTGKYKPADCSTSPTEGRACAKSKGLYFQVLPSKTVSIGFITRILALLIVLKFKFLYFPLFIVLDFYALLFSSIIMYLTSNESITLTSKQSTLQHLLNHPIAFILV